jgi:formate dehydrogenase (coenzyme F420) beta subunit
MSKVMRLEVKDRDPVASLAGFFKSLLEKGDCAGLLVPQRLPVRNVVMPTLVTDPEQLEGTDPLAPAFPLNAAKVVSRLTRKPLDGRLAVVLRPCEMRAFIELVKLKQGSRDGVLLIGLDCFGAYSNLNYTRFAGISGKASTLKFYENIQAGSGTMFEDFDITTACMACEHPVPENADVLIGLLGNDWGTQLTVESRSASGEELLTRLGLPESALPEGRTQAIEQLVAERTAYRDQMFADTSAVTDDLNKLMNYLSTCVNCLNCRVACPVCYCKECVFVTDVFDHEPTQYLRWAKRKGVLKMPTDTVFYHLTRLAHMSTACVGCGQCSNACPNNIPVMELFRTISSYTQGAFNYVAGRSIDDEPPLSTFREREFSEVTGGKD